MQLYTQAQFQQLLANAKIRNAAKTTPVIKLFTPDGAATWLISEIDPDDHDTAFGLCDLGMGSPELGYVSMSELRALRGKMRLPVERDLHFRADKSLAEYASEACTKGYIRT